MGNYNRDNRQGSNRSSGGRDFNRGGSGRSGRTREMHDAVCDKCGNNCKVPFRPTSGKPVYCEDCFERPEGRTSSPRRPNLERRDDSRPRRNEQLEAINQKLDKILEMLTAQPLPEEAPVVEKKKKKKKLSKRKLLSKK